MGELMRNILLAPHGLIPFLDQLADNLAGDLEGMVKSSED